ncbi:MAG: class I SAM-dependent methyltransferase [Actinomycetota bacterium]|nr:class I SAM-dependent methyltransferase [Actinomycetota bacterium]
MTSHHDARTGRAAGTDGWGGTCPACDTPGMHVFHRQGEVPVNSCLLLPSLDEARGFPRGRLELGFCGACGFIGTVALDRSLIEYSTRYEETQGFSSRFREFAVELAQRWVDTYDLHGKTVLEIGCGKGEFLVDLIEAGAGWGVGIDPSCIPERRDGPAAARITWIQDFYGPRYADIEAEAIVCRHTLEHIPDVGRFMRLVREVVGDRTEKVILFEVPDVVRVLRETAFWDVYYEHCSYFSPGSLARLFRATGFEVLDLRREYDGQYLIVEARPSRIPAPGEAFPIEEDPAALRGVAEHFAHSYTTKLATWREEIGRVHSCGGRTVIWGAGSKGVAYLTSLGLRDQIEFAVDINPFKHGMYLAGTGHRIVAPEFLASYRPDLVIAMNAIYRDEIRSDLDKLGVDADLVAV